MIPPIPLAIITETLVWLSWVMLTFADSAGYHHRNPGLVVLGDADIRRFHRFQRGGGPKLHESVHSARLLPAHQTVRVELLDLRRDRRAMSIGVERGDRSHAGLSRQQTLPRRVDVQTQWTHDA
jgi:hypothetical protein